MNLLVSIPVICAIVLKLTESAPISNVRKIGSNELLLKLTVSDLAKLLSRLQNVHEDGHKEDLNKVSVEGMIADYLDEKQYKDRPRYGKDLKEASRPRYGKEMSEGGNHNVIEQLIEKLVNQSSESDTKDDGNIKSDGKVDNLVSLLHGLDEEKEWPRPGKDWPRAGKDWPRAGKDWPRAGKDWPRAGKDWPRAGKDWPRPGKDQPNGIARGGKRSLGEILSDLMSKRPRYGKDESSTNGPSYQYTLEDMMTEIISGDRPRYGRKSEASRPRYGKESADKTLEEALSNLGTKSTKKDTSSRSSLARGGKKRGVEDLILEYIENHLDDKKDYESARKDTPK
uniref:Pp4 n=1 Tax=Clytia hemisphaerica TaxID=252671 RepID=A0A1W6LRX4_9CNID|nr:pp4 precursor [Clytia hemisphaerica]